MLRGTGTGGEAIRDLERRVHQTRDGCSVYYFCCFMFVACDLLSELWCTVLGRGNTWGGSIEWKGQKILRVCLSAKISRIWLQIHVFGPKISLICPFAFCPVSAHASCRDSSPLLLSSIRITHRNYAPAHPGIRRTHTNVLRLYMHEQRAENCCWTTHGAPSVLFSLPALPLYSSGSTSTACLRSSAFRSSRVRVPVTSTSSSSSAASLRLVM